MDTVNQIFEIAGYVIQGAFYVFVSYVVFSLARQFKPANDKQHAAILARRNRG